MNTLISIIMPAYNAEKYLETAVKSVLCQTYGNFELIIVDDGSADNTLALAEKLKATDGRIRTLHRENGGISAARNTGLDIAVGDYVYFMDSDDTIEPFMLEKIVSAIDEYTPDIIEFGIRFVYEDGSKGSESSPKLPKKLYVGDEVRDFLLAETIATSPTKSVPNGLTVYSCVVVYSMALIRRFNWHMASEKEFIYEDYYTRLQLFGRAERVVVLPDVLYNYLQVTNSSLHKFKPERFARVAKLYEDALSLCNELGYNDNVRKRCAWFFISNTNIAMYAMLNNVKSGKEQRKLLADVLNNASFKKAVDVWKGARMPRSRRMLFCAFRSRSPMLLQLLYKYQLNKMQRK